MARLNDIPPSIESLDACTYSPTLLLLFSPLNSSRYKPSPNTKCVKSYTQANKSTVKRRFTRQNRDLARTNSAQSLRIRNLETEISRLLSENISLREAAIASQKESERWRAQYGLGDEVRCLKEKLERKLSEVGVLVDELGGLPEKVAERRQRRKSSHGILGEARSPAEKDWRNRQTLAGVLTGSMVEQEGRLPPIVEDKLYPRRTLEPLEIKDLVDLEAGVQSESPDLGPPPVAHFDVAEPIDYEAGRRMSREALEDAGEEDIVQHVNLETRRKRRTSSLLKNMTVDQSESEGEKSETSLFKSGAKRKLDVSELEGHAAQPTSNSEPEDFVFQRRPALKPASNRKSSRFSNVNQREIVIPDTVSSPQKAVGDERKALAPKGTNSPSKRPAMLDGKPEIKRVDMPRRNSQAAEPANASERLASRKAPTDIVPPPSQSRPSEPKGNKIENDIAPKTPFLPSDILSPPSTASEPITSQPPSARLPSEAAIINSVEDVLNGSIGRGSRRARAAVNYAQPNLRDKMRRPGGKVGAVEGADQKRGERGESIGSILSRSTSEDVEARVKKEDSIEGEERWRNLPLAKGRREEPGSPLRDKKSLSLSHFQQLVQPSEKQGEASKAREPERDRKDAIKRHAQARQAQKALLHDQDDDPKDQIVLRQAVEKLNIFDGPASSPHADDSQGPNARKEQPSTVHDKEAGTTRRKAPAAIGREAGRRHSMAPSSSNLPSIPKSTSLPHVAAGKENSVQSSSKVMSGITHSRNGSAPLRPSSVASARSDKVRERDEGGLKRSTSVSVLKGQPQHNPGNSVGSEGEGGRAERMASRRRSMMV